MRSRQLLVTALALLALLATAAVGSGAPPAPPNSELEQSKGFRKAVTVAGIREHQAALQAIATDNNGTRASGTDGYADSVDYVVAKLQAAGYSPQVQDFEFAFFQVLAPPTLAQISPNEKTYVLGSTPPADFQIMTYSGSGDVTAQVQEVNDNQFPPGPVASSSNAGCEDEDYAGFVPGRIALIQRGTCTFHDKALQAQTHGASAVIIFNEGQANLGRFDVVAGTAGAPDFTVPVLGASFPLGEELHNLLAGGPVTLHVTTSTISQIRETSNVLAETAGGDANKVVVVGAHLDSRIEGPGINDNGSGSATILELAEVYAAQARDPRNKIRFIWFGAEELNLLGSTAYVNGLSDDERAKIALMLNFDMVGSPNFVRFVYDGDGSSTPTAGPAGSAQIEQVFLDYFDSVGLATDPTAFDGRSDYGPFIAQNIPAGGLFTGAEGLKTAAQVAIYGGTAGQQYDPCYHLACDTFANNNNTALDQMSDAAAHAVLTFSRRMTLFP